MYPPALHGVQLVPNEVTYLVSDSWESINQFLEPFVPFSNLQMQTIKSGLELQFYSFLYMLNINYITLLEV